MALNNEYFDSINIEIAKKKYYNANKVEAVLADIRTQALALNQENEELKAQLNEMKDFKCDISDTFLSAKTISQSMIREAAEQAAALLEEAENQAAEILEKAKKQAAEIQDQCESTAKKQTELVKRSADRMEALFRQCAEELNEELESLRSEIGADKSEAVPADLESKVGAIADRLFSISIE